MNKEKLHLKIFGILGHEERRRNISYSILFTFYDFF